MRGELRTAARLLLAGLLLLGGLKVSAVFAQAPGSTLSPAAKGAFIQGVSAADQKDWELAIKYFGQAREEAPIWPDALYNLAYSHQQAGGRELIAIAWYQAYLAAAPGAADADQGRIWIVELEGKVESRVRRLIRNLEEISSLKNYADIYEQLARSKAKLGDIAGAKEAAARIPNKVAKSRAYEDIADGQADAGDIAGALESAARITDDAYKSSAYFGIVYVQTEAGDIAGAKATASRIDGGLSRDTAYGHIVKAQAKTGDIAGAKETAARIRDIEFALGKSSAYRDIAEAQARAGNIAGARETSNIYSYEEYKEMALLGATKETLTQVQEAEIDTWTRYASHLSESSFISDSVRDWQGWLEELENEEAGSEFPRSLARAALDIAHALNFIRYRQAFWQKRRAKAAR